MWICFFAGFIQPLFFIPAALYFFNDMLQERRHEKENEDVRTVSSGDETDAKELLPIDTISSIESENKEFNVYASIDAERNVLVTTIEHAKTHNKTVPIEVAMIGTEHDSGVKRDIIDDNIEIVQTKTAGEIDFHVSVNDTDKLKFTES